MTTAALSLDPLRLASDRRLQADLMAEPTLKTLSGELTKQGGLDAGRRRFLAESLRVTERMIPELVATVREVLELTGLGGRPREIYVRDEPVPNAACVDYGSGPLILLFTSTVLERLAPGELRFVIGHEAAHAAFKHTSLPAGWLLRQEGRIDPRLALSLMSWNRRAEISCDRVGLAACRSLQDATTALIKLSCGLKPPMLRFFVDDYIAQMREIESMGGSGNEDFYSTHPFSPLRVSALMHFSDSRAYADTGRLSAEEGESRVESLLKAMEPGAVEAQGSAARDAVIWGGLWLSHSDGKLDPSEDRALDGACDAEALRAARAELASTPSTAAKAKEKSLAAAAACRALPLPDRHALVQKLIVVARADNVVTDAERRTLVELCQAFDVEVGFIDRILRFFE